MSMAAYSLGRQFSSNERYESIAPDRFIFVKFRCEIWAVHLR